MGIKRYYSSLDNTITNAYQSNMLTRATASNMGAADVVEVFSIYAQQSTGSAEEARILIQFPMSNITTDRNAGLIPASGSVKFVLNLYNAEHTETLPRDFTLDVLAISSEWEEGFGLDMDNYTDKSKDHIGSNWVRRAGTTAWTTQGGDYHLEPAYSATFDVGTEDMEVDITGLVEEWVASEKSNYGIGIKLSSSYQPSSSANLTGSTKSYYTKKFFGRTSEYFFKRPNIEARWEGARKDHRGDFFYSSSLSPAAENLNTIYFYNVIRGRLKNIPSALEGAGSGGTGSIYVSLFSGSSDNSEPFGGALVLPADGTYVNSTMNTVVTGGYVSTGVYSASFAVTGTQDINKLFDVWFLGGNGQSHSNTTIQYHTGAIYPKVLGAYDYNPSMNYVVSMPNLKSRYFSGQTERFRLHVRKKNWSPSVYTRVVDTPETLTIESASYAIVRTIDNETVIQYGTGSNNYSSLSYDVSGNYFDFDMNLLEPGYMYGFKFSFYEDAVSSYREQPYLFKFKVENDEY
jgi:hypothetical protein